MEPLIEAGATGAGSPAEAAGKADVVITMLSDPQALVQVTEGTHGIAAAAGPSLTVIDMSTVGSAAVRRLAAALPAGTSLLDAPVLGSLAEAESGSLHIFVGGPNALVERWNPLLSAMGSPLHVGPLGAGAAAKLVANTTLVGTIGLLGEALALAAGLGLARDAAFDVLSVTALGTQAERRRPSVESGEYPPRFPLSLAHKDAELIAEAASASKVDLRVEEAARSWLAEAQDAGWGDQDYSAVLAWILRER
jgi:3-hydroxyisobutyrate dehydrogenase-like beta-hydroxyacid dehydrogenase